MEATNEWEEGKGYQGEAASEMEHTCRLDLENWISPDFLEDDETMTTPNEKIQADLAAREKNADKILQQWRRRFGCINFMEPEEFDKIPTLPEVLKSSELWKGIAETMPKMTGRLAAISKTISRNCVKYAVKDTTEHLFCSSVYEPFLEAVFAESPCHAGMRGVYTVPLSKTWLKICVSGENTELPPLSERKVDIVVQLPSWPDWEADTMKRSGRILELSPYLTEKDGTEADNFVIIAIECKGWTNGTIGWSQILTAAFGMANMISHRLSCCGELDSEESYSFPIMLLRGDNFFISIAHFDFEKSGAIRSVRCCEPYASTSTLRSETGQRELAVVLGRIVKWAHDSLRPWWSRVLAKEWEVTGCKEAVATPSKPPRSTTSVPASSRSNNKRNLKTAQEELESPSSSKVARLDLGKND